MKPFFHAPSIKIRGRNTLVNEVGLPPVSLFRRGGMRVVFVVFCHRDRVLPDSYGVIPSHAGHVRWYWYYAAHLFYTPDYGGCIPIQVCEEISRVACESRINSASFEVATPLLYLFMGKENSSGVTRLSISVMSVHKPLLFINHLLCGRWCILPME
jgi:hypothetical protein